MFRFRPTGLPLLELVQPEVEAAMIPLRALAFENPVRWLEGRVGHVCRWWHVGLPRLLGPLGPSVGPVIVGEVVVRVIKHLGQTGVDPLGLTSRGYKSGQEGYQPRLDEQGAHHAASPPVWQGTHTPSARNITCGTGAGL